MNDVRTRGLLGSPYWRETKRPIYAISVVIPMLLCYEMGLAALGQLSDMPVSYRNGVDAFIQALLGRFGLYGSLISVAVVVVALIVWQLAGGQSWRARGRYVVGIILEAVLYATALLAVVYSAQTLIHSSPAMSFNAAEEVLTNRGQAVVLSFGAGVYEEFVFRLLLVPLAVFVLRHGLGASRGGACAIAAVFSGLLFAASHYVGPAPSTLNVLGFAFRTFAGTLFAALFLARGFAVTSLFHALYDVGAALLPWWVASG